MQWRGPFGGGAASGKSGAVVASHNRYGQYLRARVVPTDPQSALQLAIRAIMTTLVAAWSDVLSSAQRAGWDLYAENTPRTNKLGDPVFFPGQVHYIRSNVPRVQVGLVRKDTPPGIFGVAPQDPTLSFTASEATQVLTIAYDDTTQATTVDDGGYITYQGQPRSPTRNFYAGPWRFGTVVVGNTAAPPVSPLLSVAKFPIVEGQLLSIQARLSFPDGRLSDPFRATGTVAA